MSEPVVVEILGERWRLPDAALRARWSRCLSPATSGNDLGEMSGYPWTSRATIESIHARAGQWLMFHAAGVAMTNGSVVALVGPSGTGKSTAARTLCRERFGYVSDETVAIRPDGSVVPFPKPIAIIPSSGGTKLEFGPDELGLQPCPPDLKLDGVIRLERNDDFEAPASEELGLLEGMIAVIPDMSALPQLKAPLAWLARVVEQCGGVHRVRYRNADQLYEPIIDVLAVSSKASGFTHHPSGTSEVDVQSGHVRRSAYTDAIELDGEVLLLQGSQCTLLGGIGGLIWLLTGNPCTVDQVVRGLTAAVGDHPDATKLAEDAIRELETMGVLLTGASDPREHGTS